MVLLKVNVSASPVLLIQSIINADKKFTDIFIPLSFTMRISAFVRGREKIKDGSSFTASLKCCAFLIVNVCAFVLKVEIQIPALSILYNPIYLYHYKKQDGSRG